MEPTTLAVFTSAFFDDAEGAGCQLRTCTDAGLAADDADEDAELAAPADCTG